MSEENTKKRIDAAKALGWKDVSANKDHILGNEPAWPNSFIVDRAFPHMSDFMADSIVALEQRAIAAEKKLESLQKLQVAHVETIAAERAAKQSAEHLLREILASIHCDGGHYAAEHGLQKATEDAIKKRSDLVVKLDAAEQSLSEAQREIERLKGNISVLNLSELQKKNNTEE